MMDKPDTCWDDDEFKPVRRTTFTVDPNRIMEDLGLLNSLQGVKLFKSKSLTPTKANVTQTPQSLKELHVKRHVQPAAKLRGESIGGWGKEDSEDGQDYSGEMDDSFQSKKQRVEPMSQMPEIVYRIPLMNGTKEHVCKIPLISTSKSSSAVATPNNTVDEIDLSSIPVFSSSKIADSLSFEEFRKRRGIDEPDMNSTTFEDSDMHPGREEVGEEPINVDNILGLSGDIGNGTATIPKGDEHGAEEENDDFDILPSQEEGEADNGNADGGNSDSESDGDHTTNSDDGELSPNVKKVLRQMQQVSIPEYLEKQSREILNILRQTIASKESHSAIIIGNRHNYKSSIINTHLDTLNQTYPDQCVFVRLNGHLHDETSALKSIARQLDSQLKTEIQIGSVNETFEKILSLLTAHAGDKKKKKSVVFVIDEIHTFTGALRQTLLYNLFDMVENSSVPVCILGCTTALTVLEHLEKRVKSRFSQRQIYLPLPNWDQFQEVVLQWLLIEDPVWDDVIRQQMKEGQELYNMCRQNFVTMNDLIMLKHMLYHWVQTNKIMPTRTLNDLVLSLSDVELAIIIAAARVVVKDNLSTVNFNMTYEEYSGLVKIFNTAIPTAQSGIKTLMKLWTKTDIKHIWENLVLCRLLSAHGVTDNIYYTSASASSSYDLKMFDVSITLEELRRCIGSSNKFYSWTSL